MRIPGILAAIVLLFALPARPSDDNKSNKNPEHHQDRPRQEHQSAPPRQEHQAAPRPEHHEAPARMPSSSPNNVTRHEQRPQPTNVPSRDHGPTTQVERRSEPGLNPARHERPPVVTQPGAIDRTHVQPPTRVYRNPSGTEAHVGSNGRVETVHARGMSIYHSPGGRIEVHRPDHVVIVTNARGHGYIQRPFVQAGHSYVARTYYVRGVAYARYYRPYTYRGVVLHAYVPVRYYAPGFYGWVYNPWAAPVYYRWGWGVSTPWFGFYSGYFAPAPYYPTPALWLTDYLISQQLMLAYQEQQANAAMQAQAYSGSQLTPETKQAIAAEVQRQLQLENEEAQMAARRQMPDASVSGLPQMLSDNRPHVFVVSYNLEVTNSGGQTCALGRGDVLQLTQPPPPDAVSTWVQVMATRGGGCRPNTTVSVPLADLQDMNNQMRETLNQGMSELQSHAGQNGLPALPASAAAPPTPAPFAEAAPPPDPNVSSELNQQFQDANRVEREVLSEARVGDASMPPAAPESGPPAPAQPATVTVGQSQAEVVSILGNPMQILKAGKKEIYRYKDLKVTFVSGKVTDVE
jgi:hypothetical protein